MPGPYPKFSHAWWQQQIQAPEVEAARQNAMSEFLWRQAAEQECETELRTELREAEVREAIEFLRRQREGLIEEPIANLKGEPRSG